MRTPQQPGLPPIEPSGRRPSAPPGAAWQARRREFEQTGPPESRAWRLNVPRRAGQAIVAGVVVAALFLVGLLVVPKLRERDTANPTRVQPTAARPLPSEPVQSLPPTVDPSAPPGSQAGRPADSLAVWARQHQALGIPVVALQAYGYAQAVIAQVQPSCHLTWTVLAGIGRVESDHGRFRGATLHADGTSSPRIIGVPLNGIATKKIGDTDRGALDGDTNFDRAVGPMQFIPATWKTWAVDADRDGKEDPYDIDDAAMAAAYFLCGGGHDLGTGPGWWSAVLSYNQVEEYAVRVYAETDRYGRESRKI